MSSEGLKRRTRLRRQKDRPDPLVDVGRYIGWFAARWSKHKRLSYRSRAVHFVRCLEAAGRLDLCEQVELQLAICYAAGLAGAAEFPRVVGQWVLDVLAPIEAARPRRRVGDLDLPWAFDVMASRQFDLGRAQFAKRAIGETAWVRELLSQFCNGNLDAAAMRLRAQAFLRRYDVVDFKTNDALGFKTPLPKL